MMKTILLALLVCTLSCMPMDVLDYMQGTVDVVARVYVRPEAFEVRAPLPRVKIKKDVIDKYLTVDTDGKYRVALHSLKIKHRDGYIHIEAKGYSAKTDGPFHFYDRYLISPFGFVPPDTDNGVEDSVHITFVVKE